jgi:hypothetical protein
MRALRRGCGDQGGACRRLDESAPRPVVASGGAWRCAVPALRWRPDTNKHDPNDARSVAVAALRSATRREVKPDDHAAVLKVWSKRHRDLGSLATR